MKTVQELLEPRYRVIADYPNSIWSVGYIIKQDGQNFMNTELFDGYPNIFKKLEWWEERSPDDMPEYVRFTKSTDNEVWEAKDWKVTKVFGMEFWNESGGRKFRNICSECCVVPATESEYTTYISQT